MTNQLIAFWGSPSSGKTTLAIKVAKILAARKQNTIVVGCDPEIPFLPLVYPSGKDFESLGDLLVLPKLTENAVLQHCTPFHSKHLSLIGYRKKDNPLTYAEYDSFQARELLSLLRKVADYIIIDCTSHVAGDKLTSAALETADLTFKVVTPNPRSLIYIESQKGLLQQKTQYRYGEQINIINNALPSQDVDLMSELIGGAHYVFPNVPELPIQYDQGEIFETVFGKGAKDFEMGLEVMVREVIQNNEVN